MTKTDSSTCLGVSSRWLHVALPSGELVYIQRGDVSFQHILLSLEEMCQYSKNFLGLPYTYGGRSSFGYDCSGYVQMLYRLMGIFIPRDSKDQIHWDGFSPTTVENLHPGDLIFFGPAEDKVGHVGMFLRDEEFIHAGVSTNMPYIRIARLADPDFNGSGRWGYRAFRTIKKQCHEPLTVSFG